MGGKNDQISMDSSLRPRQVIRPANSEERNHTPSSAATSSVGAGEAGLKAQGARGMLLSGLQALRRNWPVAVAGVLLTVGLVGMAASLVPASYVATSQMVLLPPAAQPSGSETTEVNPYLNLAGLQGMADIVARSMMDDETVRTLKRAGATSYTVQHDTLSAAPVLLVTAEERSPARARSALVAVTKQVPRSTARLQAATTMDRRFYVTTSVVAGPGDLQRSGKSQLRAVGVALVAGLVMTQLSVSLFDAWRQRRARMAAGRSPTAGVARDPIRAELHQAATAVVAPSVGEPADNVKSDPDARPVEDVKPGDAGETKPAPETDLGQGTQVPVDGGTGASAGHGLARHARDLRRRVSLQARSTHEWTRAQPVGGLGGHGPSSHVGPIVGNGRNGVDHAVEGVPAKPSNASVSLGDR